jgi:hypothetical protein
MDVMISSYGVRVALGAYLLHRLCPSNCCALPLEHRHAGPFTKWFTTCYVVPSGVSVVRRLRVTVFPAGRCVYTGWK